MLLIIITILGLSIGYSALNSDLSISGEAKVKVDNDLRITNVKLKSQINGAYEEYNYDYSIDTTSFYLNLPNINSTITYEITVENDSPYKFRLSNIERDGNVNIVYTIPNLTDNDVIEEKEIKTYTIQISSTQNNTSGSLLLKYNFERYYPNVDLGKFAQKIIDDNGGIDYIKSKEIPDYNTVSKTNEGLYITSDNDGSSYYFRGIVDNNYVSFAGFIWRIIRVNGDGTVRMILEDTINDGMTYEFFSQTTSKLNMYYKNSINENEVKYVTDKWYKDNLISYEDMISSSAYCEQARVAYNDTYASSSGADMQVYTEYTPRLTCDTDKNGYNIVKEKIGLITYDEVVLAGGVPYQNSNYYLKNGSNYWTISTAGFSGKVINQWLINSNGYLYNYSGRIGRNIRPVISVIGDLDVMGIGTIEDPYRIG